MIEVRDIHKSFEGTEVLHGISTVFPTGKVSMTIGLSGSGKTVLMKSIIGLHQVDSGHILYDGRDITQVTMKEIRRLRREIGMLFQGSALFDSMSVLENVLYPLEMFSQMSKQEMQERARFCLERVNMPERAFRLTPAEISGGMQKRVAIARAIALNPKYLFCDEPNSGLDPQTSLVIDQLLHSITHEFGITTIVNTHDMNSIMEIGEHIVFIDKGYKGWEGSKDDIFYADNENLNKLVFASELYQKVKAAVTSEQKEPSPNRASTEH